MCSATSVAPQSLPATIGDRVRVTVVSERSPVVGTLVDDRADRLTLRTESQQAVDLPYASIARLEVSRGLHPHMLKGAVAGAVGGAGIGAIVGATSNDQGPRALGRGGLVALGVGMGSAGGIVIGAALGALIRTERWRDVPVSVAPPLVTSGNGMARPNGDQPIGALRIAVAWLGR